MMLKSCLLFLPYQLRCVRKLFLVALTNEVDLSLLKRNGFNIEELRLCVFTGNKDDRGCVDGETNAVLKQQIANNIFFTSNGSDVDVLFTGIGKINATYALTRYICEIGKPDVIYNIGTAGCCHDDIDVGDLVLCDKFIQLDMNATPQNPNEIGFTPYDDIGFIIDNGVVSEENYHFIKDIKNGNYICATMDTFNVADINYDVYDMEAYALAKVALRFGIDFVCVKYITDNILNNKKKKTDEDWKNALEDGRKKLTNLIIGCL